MSNIINTYVTNSFTHPETMFKIPYYFPLLMSANGYRIVRNSPKSPIFISDAFLDITDENFF